LRIQTFHDPWDRVFVARAQRQQAGNDKCNETYKEMRLYVVLARKINRAGFKVTFRDFERLFNTPEPAIDLDDLLVALLPLTGDDGLSFRRIFLPRAISFHRIRASALWS